MKDGLKKNCIILLAVLGFILIGPVIINYLFKFHASLDFLVAEWDASAMLSYYGTIVAALIALYGIFITIQYSQKSYKDDVRNRSMPFIVIDVLKISNYRNLMKPNITEATTVPIKGYREYKLTDYYCILDEGKIEFKTGLTKSQQDLLDSGGMRCKTCKNGINMQVVDEICIPLEIENVGNGAAIRMRYGFNRKETCDINRKYLPVISLKQGTPIMLHIFSEDCSENSVNLGQYVLSFFYEDIYSNRYEQYFDINIEYDEEKKCPIVSVDMSHVQKFLGGK